MNGEVEGLIGRTTGARLCTCGDVPGACVCEASGRGCDCTPCNCGEVCRCAADCNCDKCQGEDVGE